ncbi:MAG: hypothetical protein JWQ63_4358 [Mucilaginibacter sp.]|nr:hypothetical protein [Mucilaginibacter sp.]
MNEHRFILQPYCGPGSRFRCPKCQHRNKTFSRYIDLENDSYLDDNVGRCDRADKCGYHYTPRQYFGGNPYDVRVPQIKTCDAMPVNDLFNHLPTGLVKDSMMQKACIHNNFILFLAEIFGWETALQAAERYKIGTSKHWHGATVFWQVDTRGRVRTGKIMLYDSSTGKRVNQPFNHIAWVHSLVGKSESRKSPKEAANHLSDSRTSRLSDYKLQQCFFGEHLLWEDTTAIVGITESEKTAIIASIMMPDFIWLAAGSLHGLDEDKCQALKSRTVLLFPDVGAYSYWKACARSLNLKIPTATFAVHDEMERTATDEERATGADMGDRWIGEWNVQKHLTKRVSW